MHPSTRDWLIDVLLGGLLGGLVGGVVAVNLVIFSGMDRGYESSLVDVFRQNPVVGVITVAVLIAGPIAGVVVARRLRNKRVGA
jgi:hypothetical protein